MITLYHNPRCSKSREALALLQAQGLSPNIMLYLETPINSTQIEQLLKKLNISARELLRKNEEVYRELQLQDTSITEADLIDSMVKNPKLIERPIFVNGDKAVIGRPPENVLAII
jgi:arsenate reductase (glutaredoxin)